jgi:hypothetical protein
MSAAQTIIRKRRAWAHALIRRVPAPPPVYGGPAFLALPDGHPTKLASILVAAECWACDNDNLPERLQEEVRRARRMFLQLDAEEHRAAVIPLTHARSITSYAERRRQELDAAQPRPDGGTAS